MDGAPSCDHRRLPQARARARVDGDGERGGDGRRALRAGATGMRAQPTTSEAVLWEALRGSRLGVGFRRQVPIGRFIADFCAPAARLVVEGRRWRSRGARAG